MGALAPGGRNPSPRMNHGTAGPLGDETQGRFPAMTKRASITLLFFFLFLFLSVLGWEF